MHTGATWVLLFGLIYCLVPVQSLPPTSQKGTTISRCISDTITLLARRIQNLQIKTDSHLIIPPVIWKKLKGLYPSYSKFNIHGNPLSAFVRRHFKVYDNNMFISTWITLAILEAHAYGGAPKPTEEQLKMTLDATAEFYDHNRFNGSSAKSSVKTFWPQGLNTTTATWTWKSRPDNILMVLMELVPWDKVEVVLKEMELLLLTRGHLKTGVLVPPDADDTFTNLGLGALLSDFSTEFPNVQKTWLSQNQNLDDVWENLVKYAYRPFSADFDARCIDPRTYYYARKFLEDAESRGEDIALATTWIQNIDETRYMPDRGVHMPGKVNNVDIAVCSNVVFGITSAVLTGLMDISILQRPDIMQIYVNTSNFVIWQLERDFEQRPDLALPYYASRFEVYWFASRTFALLERKVKIKPLPHPVFEQVRRRFRSTLRNHVTGVIISNAKHEGPMMSYYDDFLGDSDTSIFGKPKIRGEDRIFTTSMAVNVLINSWTVFYHGKLHWDKDVPGIVTATVQKAVTWLNRYSLDSQFKPWNAFFAVVAKGRPMMPYWYPINFFQYLNGTDIPVNTTHIPEQTILAMCGTVPQTEYQTMLNQTHFGTPGTPRAFPGYNGKDILFQFWSSDSYTYSVSLLALAQFANLEGTGSDNTLRWTL